MNNNNIFKKRKNFFIIIIIYKRSFKRVREENDRDSNFKSFKNKNIKVSLLNFRVLKFNKFNYNNNVKISHIYKNNENK